MRPVLAGVVTALVGFGGAFPVVLAGLRAVGADERQAASGLLAVCVASGVVAVVLGLRTRMPVSIAWSTPGAALLIAAGPQPGGFAAAVGAFLLCGALIVLAGLVRPLGGSSRRSPRRSRGPCSPACCCRCAWRRCRPSPRCRCSPCRWCSCGRSSSASPGSGRCRRRSPRPSWIVVDRAGARRRRPRARARLDRAALRPGDAGGVGLPLFLVTMASQNVPGMAVLATYGYRPRLGPILGATGLGTLGAAPFGGHAVNLAAISAALAAGPDADPDPGRRWIASVTAGVGLAALGLGAGLATALILLSPPVLVSAVAGLALLGALARLASAVSDPAAREAAAVTFVVTAAGVTFLGIGAAFWGLLAGGAMALLHRRRQRRRRAGRRRRRGAARAA